MRRDLVQGDFTVDYTFDGGSSTSTNGFDFAYLPGTGFGDDSGTVTFVDGEEYVDILVDPTLQYNDADYEGDETVVISLDVGAGDYNLGSPSTGTLTVVDDDLPINVWIAETEDAYEGVSSGYFRLQRDDTSGKFTIGYFYDADQSSAVAGTDFAFLTGTGEYDQYGTVTFADGQATVDIVVDPTGMHDDGATEIDETVEIVLAQSVPDRAVVVILDDESERRPSSADSDHLVDVSDAADAQYHITSFQESTNTLYVDLSLTNVASYTIGAPVLVGIKDLTSPLVTPLDTDGVTPDGIPYYDISSLLPDSTGGKFHPGDVVDLELAFHNPDRIQFRYELVLFGYINQAPEFVSDPIVRASGGGTYRYDSHAADPESDVLVYEKLIGPQGLTVDAATGEVSWDVPADAEGYYSVLLRASDPDGLWDTQSYDILVTQNWFNSPPYFTSTPVVDAYVNVDYAYLATARDPDGDSPLYFSLVDAVLKESGQPLTDHDPGWVLDVTAGGLVTWDPPAELVGKTISVTLEVNDAHGGTAQQPYEIYVHGEPGNAPPHFISEPVTQFDLLGMTSPRLIGDTALLGTEAGLGTISGQAWLDVNTNGVRDYIDDGLAELIELTTTGPVVLERNDDGSTDLLDFGFTLEFYGQNYTQFYLNNNGNITFEGPESQYTADGFPLGADRPMIAPFWADVDTRPEGSAEVHMATGTSSRGNPFIQIDWPDVGYYSYWDDKLNDFTLYIEDDPDGDIVGFVYRNMEWTTGDASGGWGGFNGAPAEIGVSAANDVDYVSFGRPGTPEELAEFQNRTIAFRLNPYGGLWPAEPGIDLLTVELVDSATGEVVDSQLTRSLDLSGNDVINPMTEIGRYQFDDVSPGNYQVRIAPHGGWYQIDPLDPTTHDVTVAADATVTADFGFQQSSYYDSEAVDPDNDVLTYSLVSGPAGATVDATTGELDWVPTGLGTYHFELLVEDGRGGRDIQEFTLTVDDSNPNVPPEILSTPPVIGATERAYSYTVRTFDANFDQVVFELTTGPTGMVINQRTGVTTWTPTDAQVGTHPVSIRASDGRGGESTQNYQIEVTQSPVNLNPEILSQPATSATVGYEYYYEIVARDPEGSGLMFDLPVRPEGMQMQEHHGYIWWQPTADQIGPAGVVVRVRDANGGFALQSFQIMVTSDNAPPTITSVPTGPAAAGETWTYQVTAEDVNGDALEYRLDEFSLARGMTISSTGLVSWTPGQVGDYRVEIQVDDGRAGVAIQSFTLDVRSNAPPSFTSTPDGPATVGTAWSYSIGVDDPNGDPIELTLDQDSLDRGMDLTGTLLTWTPTRTGDFDVILTAEDGQGGTATQTFTLPSRAPVVASEPPSITSIPTGPAIVGDNWTYTVEATDPDNDDATLVFSLVDPADGTNNVTWNATTRTVTWSPTATGSLAFTVSVADTENTVQQTFTVPAAVAPASNAHPQITSVPSGPATVGVVYRYQVEAHDPDGDPLTYSVASTPAVNGLSIDSDGLLVWDAPQAAGDYAIEVTVSDGSLSRIQTFTLAAVVPNTPPKITSTPAGPAYVNQAWDYTIVATDFEDDDATLAVTLVEPVAHPDVTWNATTKTVAWTPTAAGELAFVLRATDSDGAFVDQTFTINALTAPPANGVPQITSVPIGPAVVGRLYDYQVTAVDDDPLTYSVDSAPQVAGLSISSTGLLRWNTPSAVGTQEITVTVSDGTHDVTQTFDLSVVSENHTPSITSEPEGPAYVGQTWTYVLDAFDLDGPADTLTWSLVSPTSPPPEVGFTPATQTLAWTPTIEGDMTFTVRVTDSHDAYAEQTLTVTAVTATSNESPVIRSVPTSPTLLDELYVYQIDAYDPNGDTLAYSLDAASLARGMQVTDKGLVAWTPAALGDYPIVINVDDGNGPVQQSYTLSVVAPATTNHLPEITSTPTGPAVLDSPYTYQATAEDIDGDVITWSLDSSSIPADALGNLAIGASTGLLEWTPGKQGSYRLKVTADDGTDQVSQTFTLAVLDNAPPKILSTPPLQGRTDQQYIYTVNATDPNPEDNATLVYSLEGAPENMTISTAGVVTWPSPVVGKHLLTVIVTDDDGASALQTYELSIADPANNAPPVINSNPRDTIQTGQRFLHQVDASDPDGDPLTYSLTSNPAGMTMDDRGLIDWTPASDDIGTSPHSYTVEVSDGINTPVSKTFSISAVHELDNNGPVFDSTPRTNIIVGERYLYDADATDPDGDTITYSLKSSPTGMTIHPTSGLVEWHPKTDDLGQHEMKVLAMDSLGMGVTQTVTLTVRAVNRPPQIDGDPLIFAVTDQLYTYQIEAHDPDGHKLRFETGTVPAGLTVDAETGLVQWQAPSTTGVHPVQILIYDELGMGIAFQYNIQVVDTQPNSPPRITSTPPLIAEAGSAWTYLVETNDIDPGDTVTVSLAEPNPLLANMTFATDTVTWTPDVSLVGQLFAFEVTANDGTATSKQSFSVVVHPPNSTPTIRAIPDQTVTVGRSFNYSVSANDTNGDPLTFDLDQASKSRGMTIDANGRITWSPGTAQISATPYPVTVHVSDGRADPVSTSFNITVTADVEPPSVTIVPQYTQADVGTQVTLLVHAVDNIGVASRTLTLTQVTFGGVPTPLGRELALDGEGRARLTLDDNLLPSGSLAGGTLHFDATATDVAGLTAHADTVTLLVTDPGDVDPPVAVISVPDPGATVPKITAPTSIVGSVTDNEPNVHWVLEIVPLDGGTVKQIATGNGDITDAHLGNFDPTLLENGLYRIDLIATDVGGSIDVASRTVEVDGNLKLGNFSLAFNDLEVPVAGFPITVTRSYDTLRADEKGDFGHGWELAFSNTEVKIDFGDGIQDVGLSGYQPFEDGTRVVITLPDGSTEGFTFAAQQTVSGFLRTPDYTPRFIPDYGVTSELIVQSRYLRKLGSGYIDMTTARDYTPVDPVLGGAFTLKLRNGTELAVNAQTGELSTVTDMAQNSLTFTGMGIISSNNRGVQFERNHPDGFITALIDPAGNRIEYAYDTDDNLVSMTDRVDATTQFTYLDGANAPEHYLDEIIDPLGRTAAKTVYDEDGRISEIIDADGKTTSYVWNGESKIQHVTNQLGNTTLIETDDRGNVLREQDPEGGITLRTYDNQDRLLTETTVVGQIDSIENNETNDLTTTYTYAENGDKLTETNPRGIKTTYTYNAHGQLLSSSTPGSPTSSSTYDDRGLLQSIRDASGNTTSLDYDNRGNMLNVTNDAGITLVTSEYDTTYGDLTSSTGATGQTTNFDYDINGDQVATWHFAGTGDEKIQILDRTFYDETRRTIGSAHVVLPAGQFVTENLATAVIDEQYVLWSTSTNYNLAGQIETSTDRNGLVTENTYDTRGQLIQTRSQAADSQGNTAWYLSQTVFDAAGRTTHSTVRHLEDTTEPVSGSRTTYDKAGRTIKTEQLLGLVIGIAAAQSFVLVSGTVLSTNSTQYDTTGRVTSTTNTHNRQTLTTYNPFGETTQTRSQTIDESGTTVWLVSQTVYDSLGRAIVSTDQHLENSTDPVCATRTLYDSQGRAHKTVRLQDVTITIDPTTGNSTLADPGTEISSTETIYNDKGQTTKTIAADGQTTRFEYDNLGRQTAQIAHPVPATSVGIVPPAGTTHVSLRTETVYDSLGRTQIQRTNVHQFNDGTIDRTAAQETSYEYDLHGNAIKTTFNDNTFITAAYDNLGRKLSETNQQNQTRSFEYNTQNQLTAVELPAVPDPQNSGTLTNPRYEYAYNAQGSQTLILDPLNRETTFTYDDQGRQLTRALPLDQTEQFVYNDRGQRKLEISFEGVVTEYIYDASTDRLAEKRFFDNLTAYSDGTGTPSEIVAYRYDARGRQFETIQDRDGNLTTTTDQRVTTNTYTPLGRLESVASPEGTIHYEYDYLGRHTRTYTGNQDTTGTPTASDGIAVTDTVYAYDALGRLDTVTTVERFDTPLATPEVTDYFYDLLGNLDETHSPNGVIADYQYDNLNRLELLRHFRDENDNDTYESGVDALLAEYDYTLQSDGRRTAVTETDHSGNQTQINWTYDNAGRLTRESYNSHNDSLDFITDYLFDLVGNRQQKKTDTNPTFVGDPTFDETVTYTHDANDRLITETTDHLTDNSQDRHTVYDYNNTQQTQKTVYQGLNDQGTKLSETTYAYNLQGRMSTVELGTDGNGLSDTQLTYEYNDHGIRVSQEKRADTNADGDFTDETPEQTDYLVDEQNPTGYAQVLEEWIDGQIKTSYTLGHDVLTQAAITGAIHHLLYDGHGSTRMLVDALGLPLSSEIYAYDAYGNPIGFDPAQALTTLLYSGEQTDAATGFQYLRARYYDPSTGTFNRLDPFFGNLEDPQSLHKYLYTHGNPINLSDPTGQFSIAGLASSIRIVIGRFVSIAQQAFRVYQLAERVQSIVSLLEFVRDFRQTIPSIKREVVKIMQQLADMPMDQTQRFRSITGQDVLDALKQIAKDLDDISWTIATTHGKRVTEAILSRKQPKTKRDVIVIYAPNVSGRFSPDKRLSAKIPMIDIADMGVVLSSGGGGGRLFGLGFARPKKLRKTPGASYMFLRVDWHRSRQQHPPPYAGYFETQSGLDMHWHVPTTAKDARGHIPE